MSESQENRIEKSKLILAISGFAGSGKDTACDFLVKTKNAQRVAFADTLKLLVSKQYNIPVNFLYDIQYKEKPLLNYKINPKDAFSLKVSEILFKEFRSESGECPSGYFITDDGSFFGTTLKGPEPLYHTPRSLAILEGSVKRSVDPNFWVSTAISDIKNLSNNLIVITDLRYRNELQQLKSSFGDNLYSIRIERFNSTNSLDSSELDLVGVTHDFHVENKNSLEEFYANILSVLERIEKGKNG